MALKGETKLTPEFTAKVVQKVLLGVDPEVASISAGISRSCFFGWRAQGMQGVEPYAEWWIEVARACADSEINLATKAQEGDSVSGYGPSKAALEILQRRFSKRWSVQVKVEMADQLNKFIDAAQRVLVNQPETFRQLLEALAEEPGEGEAPSAPQPGPSPVH